MLAFYKENTIFTKEEIPKNIANIYVSIICIYRPFIDYTLSGSNSQHSMFTFHKDNIFLHNNKVQLILPTNILASLVNIYSFIYDVYMDDIANMICQLYQYFIQQHHNQNI